ncbi:hypothetical protein, partial [Mesorhizobium sp. M4B.F.Ca.ET.013.02.1.1]|uniref:hypothetical protein n=1 Tax=Mesorhizobium sp. M4B.F.Ca.ET.013.02.1.1 TaxID=2496755 RepID=UPI001AECF4F1
FPHSVATSRRHLSPLRRERKAASVGEMSGTTEGGAKKLGISSLAISLDDAGSAQATGAAFKP